MGEFCESTARPSSGGYCLECSRPTGHEGLHHEDGPFGIVAVWTNDDELVELDD